jgi:hypothetical protein
MCQVDKIVVYDEISKIKLCGLRMFFSIWNFDPRSSMELVSHLRDLIKSKNRLTRKASLQMLRNYCLFNTFLLDDQLKKELVNIIIGCLSDRIIENRLSASITLSALIHSDFFTVDNQLINDFISKTTLKNGSEGAIIGLCSIVNSYPYEITPFLPKVLTHLCAFMNHRQGLIKVLRLIFKLISSPLLFS